MPVGIEVSIDGQNVSVKGTKGTLNWRIHDLVELKQDDKTLNVQPKRESKQAWALAGTTRALINNMVTGVSTGFEKKLTMVGVGYRAQAK
ncbi:unnamed protein product, partial [Cyprideis torosa]